MSNKAKSIGERLGTWLRGGRPKGARPVPFVAQLTPTDCGIAALASVLAYHEKHVPIHAVRTVLGGGRNGVNARQILTAARGFGFTARGVQIEPAKLQYLPPASILHWDLSHFVVFEWCNATTVHLVDPAVGHRVLPMAEVAKSLTGVAVVLEPSDTFERVKPERKDRLRRYARWIFRAKDVWFRVIATSFGLQVLALAVPGLMGAIVDKVVPRGDLQLLFLIAAGFLSLTSFYFLSNFLRSRLLLELRTKVESRMSLEFIEHLLALPYGFFQQRTTGDLIMRLSSQTAIRELLTTGTLSALLDGAMVMAYFVLLLGASPLLGAVAFVMAVLQIAASVVAGRKNSVLVVEGLAAQSRLEAYQVEMLGGIETLKSMGASERSTARWMDLYVDTLNRAISRGQLDGTFQALLGTLRFCGPIALLLTGAQQVLAGEVSLGTMLSLSALGAGFLEPVSNLVGTGMKLTQLKGYMERIEDVLDTPREAHESRLGGGEDRPRNLASEVRIRDLGFTYPSEPKPALHGINLDILPGECVAVVGSSGSGKSTLARILARLYEPANGYVSMDGVDLREWNLTALRERLGIVTQDTRLFSGTLRENVALFDSEVTHEQVVQACQLACLDETIRQMPMGYDTVLADGGSSLSGGQRQRLSLARALVRRPSLLILDEATSALDTVTERGVQENLRAIQCTRVIVAHRLSTIIEADKIVVLERGEMVAVGTHRELVQRCEPYRALQRAQGEDPEAIDDVEVIMEGPRQGARYSRPITAPPPPPNASNPPLGSSPGAPRALPARPPLPSRGPTEAP